jgi:hypothetical protein
MPAQGVNSFVLLRVAQTHWAVVGARGHERLMLLVLPLNSPPYYENILGAMDVLRPPYEATPLLSYGRDYSIHVNHAADCDVGGRGTLIRTPGSYVITDKDHLHREVVWVLLAQL